MPSTKEPDVKRKLRSIGKANAARDALEKSTAARGKDWRGRPKPAAPAAVSDTRSKVRALLGDELAGEPQAGEKRPR